MLPRLTQARAPLTCPVQAVNELGQTEDLSIPAERALTVYVDKRELVTLMTLGAHPEWLVLGYLRNQRLIDAPSTVDSITVDWDAGEGGATGLRVRQADEVEFEICTGRPERLTGVEKGHVVFATFERADGKDGGDFGFLVLDFRFLRSQP